MACPKHHHHHADCNPITTIRSLEEFDFDQIDANTLVVFTRKTKLPECALRTLKTRQIATHVFTSQKKLKKIFNKSVCCLNKIVFFDSNKKSVASVAATADDLGVVYKGYIYN